MAVNYENKHTKEELAALQALPLQEKIRISQNRIIEWYEANEGNVVVSFSGGKDSTVLLHMVRELYPDVKAIFANTGLEHLEIQKFAHSFDNVEFVRPKMTYAEVITEYGYPIVSKEVSQCIAAARGTGDRLSKRIAAKAAVAEANDVMNNVMNDATKVDSAATTTHTKSRTHARIELLGMRTYATPTKKEATPPRLKTRGSWYKRTCLLETSPMPTTSATVPQRSPNTEPTGSVVLSQFNKKKWLPLAQRSPFLIGEQCCHIIKESPIEKYHHQNKVSPYIGVMAAESRRRKQAWLKNGCNAFDSKKKKSTPLAFWTEQDVLNYIRLNDIRICDLYGEVILTDKKGQVVTVDKDDPLEPMPKGCKLCTTGLQRTGCVACGYGVHNERANEEPRFAKLKRINPRQYEYVLGGGRWIDNPDYDPDYDGSPDEIGWIKWNPPKLWIPSKEGLGMKFVFDYCNDLYGKKLWRYE